MQRRRLVARQRDHAHAGMIAAQTRNGAHPVQPRHVQVDHDRVG